MEEPPRVTDPVPGFGFRWGTVPPGPGRLALWHRLRTRVIPYLPRSGCDRIVTLLSESEGAQAVGDLVRGAGLDWTWIPLPSGRPPEGKRDRMVREGIRQISLALDAGESVLIHCSAGMHRTGMIAYALLRGRGVACEAALELIEAIRPHTRSGLTPERMAWGES